MTTRARIPATVLFGVATLLGVSSTIQAYWLVRLDMSPATTSTLQMVHVTPWHLLVLNLVYWYVPALVAPLIMALAWRCPLDRFSWGCQAAVHLPGALAYATFHSVVMTGTRAVLFPNGPIATGCWQCTAKLALQQLDWLLMTYFFLVGLAHAMAYRRESERRALGASQLETRLVEAQLQALQRQLHPHFLFNTLNTISGLMHTNVQAADLMIEQLADLLRMTLDTSGAQQVTLKEELDVLQKYLGIEQTRFGNRLTVGMHVDAEVLDALVPNLLLQPLVENAIRHGIAPRGRPGSIAIHATRTADDLTIQVKDSGPGAPPARIVALNQGVGLSNTRARLERLYPSAFQLTFANTDQGFSVAVTIPFHREPPVVLAREESVA